MKSLIRCSTTLAATRLFQDVPVGQRDAMLAKLSVVQLSRGSSVETGREHLYFVAEGRVRLVRVDPDSGHELTVFFCGPGDCFDAIAALGREDHDLLALAVDDGTAMSASIDAVHAWIDAIPQFRNALLTYLADQMHSLSTMVTDFRFRDTQVRLARLILNHVTDAEGNVGSIRDLPQEVLASMIGSVRQVVNRHLKDLVHEGVVEVRRGHLKVRDLELLAARAATALAGMKSE
jgi:CRP-like cAMP-binding protein